VSLYRVLNPILGTEEFRNGNGKYFKTKPESLGEKSVVSPHGWEEVKNALCRRVIKAT